jgi:hypothetical protein
LREQLTTLSKLKEGAMVAELTEGVIRLRRVQKAKPAKKIPETDAIFEQVSLAHAESEQQEDCLRISIDAKAKVKVGDFWITAQNWQVIVRNSSSAWLSSQTGTALRSSWFTILPITANTTPWNVAGAFLNNTAMVPFRIQ